MLELRDGNRKIDNQFNYSHGPAQTKQQVGLCIVAAFWCMDESSVNTNSQDSPRLELGGSHHLPPYNILYAWPWDQHPNVIFVLRLPSGNPEIPKMGLLGLWGLITLCEDLLLR